jgi:L-seryl-tRNA(Ser) seleniumtransferase
MGADAVAYSGGKCLRGPQASGLVLGSKGLLRAAYLNASPHGSQGRAMKVGKEEAMALLAAVEAFLLGRDHEAEWRMWEGYLETIRQAVADLPSVQTQIEMPGICNVTPCLRITWDPAVLDAPARTVCDELLEGEPRILVGGVADGVRVNPYMLEEGEDAIVARRLREVLTRAHQPSAAEPAAAPAVDVSGDWRIEIDFPCSRGVHSMQLTQREGVLEGTYRSQFGRFDVSGRVSGDQVSFRARYAFSGTARGEAMAGSVSLGQEWPASWKATRCG